MLRTSLNNPQEFTITYELVPGQGCGGKRLPVNHSLDAAELAGKGRDC
jgi:hypothetical protein